MRLSYLPETPLQEKLRLRSSNLRRDIHCFISSVRSMTDSARNKRGGSSPNNMDDRMAKRPKPSLSVSLKRLYGKSTSSHKKCWHFKSGVEGQILLNVQEVWEWRKPLLRSTL